MAEFWHQLIKLMIKLEDRLNKLYNLYSSMFPNYEEFWADMAYQEHKHAEWIRTFFKKEKDGSIKFTKNRVSMKDLERTVELVDKLIKEARKESRDLSADRLRHNRLFLKAVVDAMSLESLIAEKSFYKVFDADSLTLKRVFYKIFLETEVHLKRIKQMYKLYK